MSDEVTHGKGRPGRRMTPRELVICATGFLLAEVLIVIPNSVRAGGSRFDTTKVVATCVFAGLILLCFVRCPWRDRLAKTVLGILLCGSLAAAVIIHPQRNGGGQMNACIANLKQIEGGKAAWAQEEHKTTNDIPRTTDLYGMNGYILREPKCPLNGVYTIGRVGVAPRCSIDGHEL